MYESDFKSTKGKYGNKHGIWNNGGQWRSTTQQQNMTHKEVSKDIYSIH